MSLSIFRDNAHALSTNLPDISSSILVTPPVVPQTEILKPDKNGESIQNGHTGKSPPSPDVSPPPIKAQRTDKPPEKPLPAPPVNTNKSNAENISSMLNDTMNEMEKFLQHNNEHLDSKCHKEELNVDKFVDTLRKVGHLGMQEEYEQIKGMGPTGTFASTL